MSWFSPLRRAAGALSSVSHLPVIGKVLGALPVVGNAISTASLISDVYTALAPAAPPAPFQGGGGAFPGAPGVQPYQAQTSSFSAPAPMAALTAPASASSGGTMSKTSKGSGWLENLTLQDLQAMEARGEIIGFAHLSVAHRAPKGYQVYHTRSGATFALRKDVARSSGVLRHHHKPLLTGGQMNAIKKAEHAFKHLKKVGKELRFVHDAIHSHHQLTHKPAFTKVEVLETVAHRRKK